MRVKDGPWRIKNKQEHNIPIMLSLTGNLNQWEFLKLVAKVAKSQDYSDAFISGFVSVQFFFASKAKRGIFCIRWP